MPLVRFASYRQIAHDVATRLRAGRADADPLSRWPEEVIVPSRGVADAITAALLASHPAGVAGLQLNTIETLARRIVNEQGSTPRVATPAERRLAMRTAVRAAEHPMMESRGVASMLERAYRDVRDSGITLSAFARRVAATPTLREPRRTDAMFRVWQEYETLIGRLGAIDPADLLASATGSVSAATPPQLLAGFYDMTGAQLALVAALARAGRIASVWIPTDAAFAQPFIQSVLRLVESPAAEEPRASSLTASSSAVAKVEYESRLEELRGVCDRIATLLGAGVPAGEIGIVARAWDPYDVRLLDRFARESRFRTMLEDSDPLRSHRIGRGVITLLRLRERGFPRSDVLELLRAGLRTGTRYDVDATDMATRMARIAGGTADDLRPLRGRSHTIDAYIDLVAELEALTSSIDSDLLSRLSAMFRIDTEQDLAAAAAIDEVAELFRRSAVWNRGLDAGAVIDAIEQIHVPTDDDPSALPTIWAGDVMRFRGRSFSHLFAVRIQDDVFPQRRIEDPLIPDSDRRLIGLRGVGDGREEEQLLFSLLGAGTSDALELSYAIGDGFGKVLRPSRYLRPIPAMAAHARTAIMVPPSPNLRRQLQLMVRSGTRSSFDGYVGPLPESLRRKLDPVSPTQLEDFGECPQKFLLKHLLGVRDIDQPEHEIQINHRDKGSIDHRILERFYRTTPAEELERAASMLPRLPDDFVTHLDTIIEQELAALEKRIPPFNRTVRDIERRATQRVLREFLANDLDDLHEQQLVPRWFEYRFGSKHRENADQPEPFILSAGGIPVRVEGTVDRIDAGGDRLRIVDYKSGKAGRHQNLAGKIDHGVRLQLALYAMAIAHFFHADPANVSGTIKPLVVRDLKPAKFAFVLDEKRERLLQTLEIFIRSILAGEFPAFPNENDQEFNSCKYCPVNHSCRTRHDPDERHAMQQHGNPRTLLGGSE